MFLYKCKQVLISFKFNKVDDPVVRDAARKKLLDIPQDIRDQVFIIIKLRLVDDIPIIATTAAQILAVFARIEIFSGGWQNFLKEIYNHVNDTNIPVKGRKSILYFLGYLCDECVSFVLS